MSSRPIIIHSTITSSAETNKIAKTTTDIKNLSQTDFSQSASGGTYSGILNTKSERKIAKTIKFNFAILLKIEIFKSLSLNNFL